MMAPFVRIRGLFVTLPLCAATAAPCLACTTARQDPASGFAPIPFGYPPEPEQELAPIFAQDGRAPEYDASVPAPEAFLGHPVGARMAHHAEIVAAFQRWAELSPLLALAEYGRTYERRALVRAIVTSEANHARLDAIRRDIGRLFDPRELSDAEAERILDATPAIAWMGYSIHGDETSGADASLALAHHLIAARDPGVRAILDRVVVVIDPVMNPDGRERFLSQVEQSAGHVPNLDLDSMHRGRWPEGRGNHYLFDLNRDWMAGVAPETRGRWSVALELPPQLFVDAHEMGGLDTFLFYPQSPPHNPALPAVLFEWQKRFAADTARSFDEHGWGYYTREWADAWYPGYSDAWGSLNGAIGMLYEQASLGGQAARRASGRVETYRDAVRRQAVASLSNLATLRDERRAVLASYLDVRRENVDPARPGGERAFLLDPGARPDRAWALVDVLVSQGVEVWRADEDFDARDVHGDLGERVDERRFEAGMLVVPAAQPQARLVRAYLELDPRMDPEFLLEERKSLERDSLSKIYDVTASDLGRAFDLRCSWATPAPGFGRTRVEPPFAEIPVESTEGDRDAAYAWIVDGLADRSVRFAARAMELGVQVHLADEEFDAGGGRVFARGSLVVRRHENDADVGERVERAARDAGVGLHAVASGRASGEGPDLGGGHFHLLARPRVAVLGNSPVSRDGYGHLWHALDVELRMPFSILDARALGRYDLRRFNVLVLPPASGVEPILAEHAEALNTWVRAGGTLVACGDSAAALTARELDVTGVRLRRTVLDDLDAYAFAAEREAALRELELDEGQLWEPAPPDDPEVDAPADDARDPSAAPDADELERWDAWARRFSPPGVLLRAHVDGEHWLTVGCGAQMPVFFAGSYVFLSREPVRTPLRFAGAAELRLAGLLWPEARERIADSAAVAIERRGYGQVVLFAAPPVFRGFFKGTARTFANAVVYGPGMGTDPPLGF